MARKLIEFVAQCGSILKKSAATQPRRNRSSSSSFYFEKLEPRQLLAAVNGLWLLNADSDADIVALTEGAVIDLQTLATSNLNVRATTDDPVGSVRFNLTGPSPHNQTESVAPYALFGDSSGDYAAGSFAAGQYTLVATPYSGGGASGTAGTPLTLSFNVVDDRPTEPPSGVYLEDNGLVVMESENTPSDLDLWNEEAALSNYTGDGYLEFTGNSTASGPATSPLEYKFQINQPGLYYLHLRAARDTTHGQPSDHSNDAYVRVEGDYGPGPNPGNTHGDDAPLSMLKSNTKFFGGNADSFGWASGNRLDPGGDTNKRVAIYDFKAGEQYTLVVSGRSKWFSLDRIVFRHIDTGTGVAQNVNTPESELSGPTDGDGSVAITGELKKWHKTTLTLSGPAASEGGATNPFTNYRLNVTFTHSASGTTYVVPGYFAADGNAADTGATSGNQWRAHLSADQQGVWNYAVSFRTGSNVAVNDSATAGTALSPYDGVTGQFTIGATDKTGDDFRGKGRLEYVGEHYLQFAETGEYFLKQGVDSPENLLAYADFDGAFKTDGISDNRIKTWGAHVTDWNPGDPTWAGGKGKGLIGAVNYLASEELNAVSFLTMNIEGDDKNVFPYTTYSERNRLDVSKLDQWEIVFQHGDKLGMYLHFKTQETENDQLLDGGALGNNRKLYYRELIARYSHHLGMNWNLGEENTNTTQQQKDFARYFHDNDPYQHNIVLHTYPGQKNNVYTPLLGNASELTGLSLQTNQTDFSNVHGDTLEWVTKSAIAGKPWVVAVDEPGDAQHSLRPDNDAGNSHTDARKNALWGTFMAGGAGNEWYFGYGHAHSDLTAEDFRSRDAFWDYTRYAKSFFEDNSIPFWQMVNDDAISTANNDYGFYKSGEVYTVYLKNGGTTNLNLSAAAANETFSVQWFDPRNGGALQNGSVTKVNGGGTVSLGQSPNNTGQDWAILVSKDSSVVNRGVAYGDATAAYGEDAIDTTKSAYLHLPGTESTSANYTNYTKGLNRVIVDLANSQAATLTTSDFEFRVGNSNDPSGWTLLDESSAMPLPAVINGARDNGAGTQRFTLAWEDPAQTIKNQWLQVTVKAGGNTGLASDDVFYFGNQIADVFGSTSSGSGVVVNAIDTILIRAYQSSAPNSVGMNNVYDIDRNGAVNSIDTILARANQESGGGLLMLSVPEPPTAAASFASFASVAAESIAAPVAVQFVETPEVEAGQVVSFRATSPLTVPTRSANVPAALRSFAQQRLQRMARVAVLDQLHTSTDLADGHAESLPDTIKSRNPYLTDDVQEIDAIFAESLKLLPDLTTRF